MQTKEDIIKNPKSILEEDLNALFRQKDESEVSIIFSIVNLLLFKNERNTDMLDLFNTVDMDTFLRVVHLFEGRTVRFSDSKVLQDNLILAICYYLREVEGIRDWERIESFFGNFKIDRLSLALKIHNMDEWLKQKISEQVRSLFKGGQ